MMIRFSRWSETRVNNDEVFRGYIWVTLVFGLMNDFQKKFILD